MRNIKIVQNFKKIALNDSLRSYEWEYKGSKAI